MERGVLIAPIFESHGLAPCSHKEADMRLFLHAADCANQGHHYVILRANDMDVYVLAVANFQHLNLDELWLAYGVGLH